MTRLLRRLRTFLIKLLAGDDMVIVNADIQGCPIVMERDDHGLFIGCRFKGKVDSPKITLWPRSARDEVRRKIREMHK